MHKPLRHLGALSKDYLMMVSHCDSAFVVWNTLTSPKFQTTNYVEKELLVDESEQTCYMVQGNDSHEVNSGTHLDDYASFSNDHDSSMDAHALNEELFMFYEKLFEKYKLLKKMSL